MSDSSSVDRWHPSNVEWPTSKANSVAIPPGWKTSMDAADYLDGFARPGDDRVLPAAAYNALFADRGRVLAAARELAEAVEEMMNASAEDDQGARIGDAADRLDAALASFREVDQ